MATLKSIGLKIAKERRKQDLTQEDLAGLCEMDRSYLSEIENGHKHLSVTSLLKIAFALKVKPAHFLE